MLSILYFSILITFLPLTVFEEYCIQNTSPKNICSLCTLRRMCALELCYWKLCWGLCIAAVIWLEWLFDGTVSGRFWRKFSLCVSMFC